MRPSPLTAVALAVLAAACFEDDPPASQAGQTDFVVDGVPGSGGASGSDGMGPSGGGGSGVLRTPLQTPRAQSPDPGDLFKVVGNRLYHLNPHRGFVIHDLSDPTQPQAAGRLALAGHPVEMFVQGSTVVALLRQVRSLEQVGTTLQHRRRLGSRLVTIDVSDPARPRLVGQLDIAGQLHDGSTRRVEDVIYTVASVPRLFEHGWWGEPDRVPRAWIIALDVSDPARPVERHRQVAFEGGEINDKDVAAGTERHRQFLSAESLAIGDTLVVLQNWRDQSRSGAPGCTESCNRMLTLDRSEVLVAVYQASDPGGVPVERGRFQTPGFIQDLSAFHYAPATGRFHGFITEVLSDGRGGESKRNRLETWELPGGQSPRKLDAIEFGVPEAAATSMAFDLPRNRAYASWWQAGAPLLAFDLANPADLKLLGQLPGVGERAVIRPVGGGQFLLMLSAEPDERCPGLPPINGRPAAALIDVRDPTRMAVVQRRCLDSPSAEVLASDVYNVAREAPRYAEQHSDGDLNLVTLPVHVYMEREDAQGTVSARVESIVGLMTWGTDPPAIDSLPAPLHAHGLVGRSLLFRHQPAGGGPPRRLLLTASDSHLSVVDLADLRQPRPLSEIALAPHHHQSFRFGQHLVEQVHPRAEGSFSGSTAKPVELRVRTPGGDPGDTPAVARVEAASVQRVLARPDSLVTIVGGGQRPNKLVTREVKVVDMRDPARPRPAGTRPWPADALPVWFTGRDAVATTAGFVLLTEDFDGQQIQLAALDLRDLDAPAISVHRLPRPGRETSDGWRHDWVDLALVADDVEPDGFYLSYGEEVDPVADGQRQRLRRYRFLARRWQARAGAFASDAPINVPGQLLRTWRASDGGRLFLTESAEYVLEDGQRDPEGWETNRQTRLSLLREEQGPGGRRIARLLDSRVLPRQVPRSMTFDGDRVVLTTFAKREPEAGDQLRVFDLGAGKFTTVLDQPTDSVLTLLGARQGKLVMKVLREGFLALDLTDPAPRTLEFLPTGDLGGQVQFFDDAAYISAGYQGLLRLDLGVM